MQRKKSVKYTNTQIQKYTNANKSKKNVFLNPGHLQSVGAREENYQLPNTKIQKKTETQIHTLSKSLKKGIFESRSPPISCSGAKELSTAKNNKSFKLLNPEMHLFGLEKLLLADENLK